MGTVVVMSAYKRDKELKQVMDNIKRSKIDFSSTIKCDPYFILELLEEMRIPGAVYSQKAKVIPFTKRLK